MSATLLVGSASRSLAGAVERDVGRRFAKATIERFPDGEVSVCIDDPVRGEEVIILAATAPPVNDHLVELLALADACRRADAARIVAVVPYFGYARSDRRDGRRTPIMASLVAELAERAGIDHVVTVDVHTPAVEGFFRIPVDNVTAVPALATAVADHFAHGMDGSVIVAPDIGAVRLANRYARQLELPVAVCHKRRLNGSAVAVSGITGDVVARRCIIIDDMISTGGTIVESVRALNEAGALEGPIVAATHAVLARGALEKIGNVGVRNLFVTDSIEPRDDDTTRLVPTVVSIASLLATAISRLLEGGSLRELA
jgi:ribose-phosphate pyrophosphokinase